MTRIKTIIAAVSLAALSGTAFASPPNGSAKNIVLVHGAFADGSGWKGVADILRKDGYTVNVVQQPMTSLEDDVAATNRILDRQSGPTVLVGHSYGGAIITVAGNNPNVVSLVYVAAFVPDEGEQVGTLSKSKPGAATSVAPTKDGYLLVDQAKFTTDFAAGVPAAEAAFMAISQMPVNSKAFSTPIIDPAWKKKPSFGVVATEDRMINPELERSMYTRAKAKMTEIKGSHTIFITHPSVVAKVIKDAARTAK
jgi:pimeloyl-ACP methyl ester carboxylesterase